ncbi:MAG: CpsD/CapB family tyrosine-protein kinase, partial [Acidimicrobiia bacterium]
MASDSDRTSETSVIRRVFSLANMAALATAIVVFYIGVSIRDTYLAIAIAALAAGAAGGLVWYFVTSRRAGPTLADAVSGIPLLGTIPVDDQGPAPALDNPEATDRYTGLLREIEGQTSGRVLLVSSPGPGQGASSVALNLSIAAAKAGRRVMLVDADPSPNGIGRYLSSGPSPGLSDVASGVATLAEASRMWTLEDGTRFPMLPSGGELSDDSGLNGILVADAFDVVSEHADFIVIDVPPVLWSSSTPELGAHADGTILVLADNADAAVVDTAIEQLSDAGAPVLGYVRNRSTGTATLAPHRARSAIMRAGLLAVLVVLAFALYTGAQLLWS